MANVGLATCQWRRRVLHHVPVDSFPTLVLLYSECGVDAERSAGECFRVSANTIGFACRRIALHLVCSARDSVGHVVADVLTFAGELVNRLTDTAAGLPILFGGPLPKTRRRMGDSLAKL